MMALAVVLFGYGRACQNTHVFHAEDVYHPGSYDVYMDFGHPGVKEGSEAAHGRGIWSGKVRFDLTDCCTCLDDNPEHLGDVR